MCAMVNSGGQFLSFFFALLVVNQALARVRRSVRLIPHLNLFLSPNLFHLAGAQSVGPAVTGPIQFFALERFWLCPIQRVASFR
jgi:hypothetical protein